MPFSWSEHIERFAAKGKAMKINTNKLSKLLKDLQLARSKLGEWKPSDERTDLELTTDDLEGEIIDLLEEAGVTRFESGKYTLSLRNLPTFFKVTSRARLVSALRRHHLSKFLIPEYAVDMRGLKDYLSATKSTLPGLAKIENKKSLYIFEKNSEFQEIPPELFVTHGVDEDLANPAERWKQLWADLRYLGTAAYPRLIAGEKWGDWSLEEIRRYFARIVDALRSVFFPLLEKKSDSSWWKLYWESKKYMQSGPPTKEEVAEWDKKRKATIKMAEENYAGIYLVAPHGLLLYQFDTKTKILKSVKFISHLNEPLFLISENLCYGVISLSGPEEIKDLKEFKATFKEHHVNEEERTSWWNGKFPLYLFGVKWVEKYPEPIEVTIPKGIQTFIKPDNIHF